MKPNRSLWLPPVLVLIPIALSYLYTAWVGFSMGFSIPWSTHITLLISEPAAIEITVIPLILAIIMLLGVLINVKISTNIQKVNILFLVLLVLVAIPIFFKNVFAMWATISVTVAWLLQRNTTKAWLKKNS